MLEGGTLDWQCPDCGRHFPIERGILRMLPDAIRTPHASDVDAILKQRTAGSFAYEWRQFGGVRPEWQRNFLDYMQPHSPEQFQGIRVLDVGAGSGRHSREANRLGASVIAVDIGESIEVARANLPDDVLVVQADAERLPFEFGSFDFVMSIGVLHHLPDTERALRAIAPYAAPGGVVQVYLYWWPPHRSHRVVLRGVGALRRLTTRLPHRVVHALCIPLSAVLWTFIVTPYRLIRHKRRVHKLAEKFPLKTYADYPFGVLVNDQFDRFSAPIEHRFTARQVEDMMLRAGLEDVTVVPNHGWVASGRQPRQ